MIVSKFVLLNLINQVALLALVETVFDCYDLVVTIIERLINMGPDLNDVIPVNGFVDCFFYYLGVFSVTLIALRRVVFSSQMVSLNGIL